MNRSTREDMWCRWKDALLPQSSQSKWRSRVATRIGVCVRGRGVMPEREKIRPRARILGAQRSPIKANATCEVLPGSHPEQRRIGESLQIFYDVIRVARGCQFDCPCLV